MAEPLISRQYRATLFKYRKFKQRLDRRLKNNTLAELSIRHRNRLLRTIDRLRRQLATLEHMLKYSTAGLLTATALSLSSPALAQQPVPAGPEFQVNTYTTIDQYRSHVAMDDVGNYLIAWQSNEQDGQLSGIYAQRFNAAGVAQGSEFRVNTFTTGAQTNPSVAMDSDGDFVITWSSNNQDGSGYGIYAQRYNASGVALGSEFVVNTYTTGSQGDQFVAMDSDGDFVVIWTSTYQDGSGHGIYGQRYNSSGVAQGVEFLVNTYTTNSQSGASVAMDSDGDFVITWNNYYGSGIADGNRYEIYAQRYNASGVAQGAEFHVNTYTTSHQTGSSVAMNSDGDFIVTWGSMEQDGNFYATYAKRYSAAGVAQGSEFQVNTHTTQNQYNSSVAMDSDGDFVVTWLSNFQDGDGAGIYAQRFSASGAPQGSEFRVNTYTTFPQVIPSVAMDSDGDFVITWTSGNSISYGQDGWFNGIFAQRFTIPEPPPPPTALAGEFQVNTYTTSNQRDPSSARDAAGNYVIAWESTLQDDSGYGIYAQRYNAAGEPQGSEFLVNTLTTGSQLLPSVAMDSDGDFVVAWESGSQDGSGYGIYAQRFNASGAPQGSEFLVNTYTTSTQAVPSVAMDSDGDFVVTWTSAGQDGSNSGIYAQWYNASGVPQGSEFRVNTYTTGEQSNPSVAKDSDGDFVVTWNSDQDGSSFGIYAQRYNASGVAQGSEFRVNTYTTAVQTNPSVAMDSGGDFIVTWSSDGQDGSGNGIFAKRYNASGVPQSSEFPVNTFATDEQSNPSVAMDSGGDFVVVWDGIGQDGSTYGIYAQQFNALGVPYGSEILVNAYTTGYQSYPLVAMDSDGDFVVTWQSYGQDGADEGIFAQAFEIDKLPVLQTNTGLALDEGDEAIITPAMLATTDADNPAAELEYEVTLLPAHGVLEKDGVAILVNGIFTQADIDNNLVTYTHNGSETTGDSFKFTATDGFTVLAETTFTVTVTPVNDTPVIQTNTGLTLNEGQEANILSAVLSSTDVDNIATEVIYEVTSLPLNGVLKKDGVTLGLNETFAQAFINNGFITYTHDGSETTSDTFSFTVTDGAETLPEESFTITVTPVSDAPVLQTNTGLTVGEGESAVLGASLVFTDVDDTDTEIIYTITSMPSNGTVHAGGIALLTFTQFDIDGNLVEYEHNGSETTTDSFSFTVSDGTTTLPEATFALTVTPVNDAPVLQTNAGLTVDEGSEATISSALLGTTDIDNATITYAVTGLPAYGELKNDGVVIALNDTFTQADINNDLISYANDGGETLLDSFDFTVTDGNTTLPEDEFYLFIGAVSDAPVPQFNTGLTVTEGEEATVTGLKLNTVDVDDDAFAITYTITALPLNGELRNQGAGISLGETFTQAELNLSEITYYHDGGETASDSFKFTVSDGTTALTEATFNITVDPINDPLTPSVNGSLNLNEGSTATLSDGGLFTADVDNAAATIVYTVTGLPVHGFLDNNGTGIVLNGTFTQADLINGVLDYTHDGSETSADSFTFTVSDGTTTLPENTFNFTINNVSDAPILAVNETLIVDEGGEATIFSAFLSTTDIDNAASAIVYTVTSLPANGELLNDGIGISVNDTFTQADVNNNLVSFTHDASETFVDSFTFTATDGTTTLAESTFNFTINPVNDAPVLAANSGLTVDEGAGATISSTILNTTDVDNAASTIVYTVTSLPANGELKFNGLAISINDTFTQADVNNSLVSFAHDGTETTSDSFMFTVSDGTATLAESTFNFTISPVNDAPVLTTNSGLTVGEGAEATISSTILNTTDINNAAGTIVYTVTSLPANGALKNNGLTISINGTFTQADINNSLVSFAHDGTETTSDSFTFTVSDGTATLAESTFNFTINPVSDAPVIAANSGLTVNEGAAWATISNTILSTTDIDNAASAIVYTLTSLLAHGELRRGDFGLLVAESFSQSDINSGLITFTHDGSETTSDSFNFTVTDGTAILEGPTFFITIVPVSDAPVLSINTGLTVNEGDEGVISVAMLSITDVDNNVSSLTYTVTRLPDHGELRDQGNTISLNDTFTQQQINASHITFFHDGSETTTDSFDFTVSDGTTVSSQATFNITVNAINDAPVLLVNSPLSITEGSEATISSTLLNTSDGDNAASTIIYTLTELPLHGELQKNGVAISLSGTFTQADLNNNQISFDHDGSETTGDSFMFSVTDGTTSLSFRTFNIEVLPLDNPPVLETNTGATIDEGGEVTIHAGVLNTSDVDTNFGSIVYTIIELPAHALMLKAGAIGGVGGTFTQSDINAGLITVRHDGSETVSDYFSFTVSDGTTTLAGASFYITIIPGNDDPYVSTNAGLTVDEGAEAILSSTLLNSIDAESGASAVTYIVTALPLRGELQLHGASISVNGQFTQADINNGFVTYQHDGSETTLDSFSFKITDLTVVVDQETFNITIAPVSDAPLIQDNAGLTLDEGATATIGTTLLKATDADNTLSQISYKILALPLNGTLFRKAVALTTGGTFTQLDVDFDDISYHHNGSETTADQFFMEVSDGTSTLPGFVFQISINPVADGLLSQTINFAALADKTDGDAAFTLTATASSSLAVAFSVVSGPATISGNTLTITGPGPITVRASQAGNGTYDPATVVDQTFCAKPKKATITVQDQNTATPKLVSSAGTGNQWFKGTDQLVGQTNSLLTVTEAGIYKVQVTVGGCVGEMSNDFAVVITGGLSTFSSEVVLSPNPAADFVTVDGLSGGVSETTVTDMSGRKQHLHVQQQGTQVVVDARGLSRGTYLIAITDGDNIHRLKFIKY